MQLPAYFTESPDSPVRYTPTRSRTPSMTSRRTRSRSRSPSVKRSLSPPARERGPQPPDRSRGYHHDRGPPAPDRDRERATSRHEPRTQYHSQDAPPRYSPPRQEERSAGGPNPRGQAPGKGGPSWRDQFFKLKAQLTLVECDLRKCKASAKRADEEVGHLQSELKHEVKRRKEAEARVDTLLLALDRISGAPTAPPTVLSAPNPSQWYPLEAQALPLPQSQPIVQVPSPEFFMAPTGMHPWESHEAPAPPQYGSIFQNPSHQREVPSPYAMRTAPQGSIFQTPPQLTPAQQTPTHFVPAQPVPSQYAQHNLGQQQQPRPPSQAMSSAEALRLLSSLPLETQQQPRRTQQ